MTDHEIGRLVKAIEDIGQLDNTLIFYIAGDNGASAEGGMNGLFNEMTYFNGVQEKVSDMLKLMDKWGGPETYPHMAAGWAVAGDTPFMWTKQVASDLRRHAQRAWSFTGRRVSRPKGEMRSQWHHVIDVAPTVLEAAGLAGAEGRQRHLQTPIEGVSMAYTFDDAEGEGPAHHAVLSRSSATAPSITTAGSPARSTGRRGRREPRRKLADDMWELYDTRTDFSLANDLAAKNPQKLDEMQALFMKEAEKYHVLPIDDRVFERLDPRDGRPPRPDGGAALR